MRALSLAVYAIEGSKTGETRYLIYPNASETFTRRQVTSNMYFTELAKPEAHTPRPINMDQGSTQVVDISQLFSGDELYGYGFTPDPSGRIEIVSLQEGSLVIRGKSSGTAVITITRSNPSGTTPVEITVNVR